MSQGKPGTITLYIIYFLAKSIPFYDIIFFLNQIKPFYYQAIRMEI